MKIVNLKQFRELPPHTLFAKYEPCVFGELAIKDQTLEHDFFMTSELSSAIKYVGGQFGEVLDRAQETRESLELDLETLERDGCFDDNQLFAVWEEADVRALIERLKQCLPESRQQEQGQAGSPPDSQAGSLCHKAEDPRQQACLELACDAIKKIIPAEAQMGFALFLFDLGGAGHISYASSVNDREQMVWAIGNWVRFQERAAGRKKAEPDEGGVRPEERLVMPQWIAASTLSLAEIGAMACVACSETNAAGWQSQLEKRLESAAFRDALNGLRKKGVLSTEEKDGELKMKFNLDAVLPE